MRIFWVWTVLVLLLPGCSSTSDDGPGTPGPDGAPDVPAATAMVPLRFASGDFEATDSFEATFSSLDACIFICTATASQSFDLTALIPADAPVELAVTVDGTDGAMGATLYFTEASASRQSENFQATAIHLAATVVRDPAGTVELRVSHAFPISPSADPVVVTIDARAVVRADQLLPAIPASLRLTGGETVSITGPDVTHALLLAQDGSALRARAPDLNITLSPAFPAATYFLVVEGGPAVVLGPNTTFSARRVVLEFGAWQPLTMGTESTWDLEVGQVPLQVGVVLRSQDSSTLPYRFTGPFRVALDGPDATRLIEGTNSGCDLPFCQGGIFTFDFATPFLDERLLAGTYTATAFVETGNAVEAAQYYVTVL